MSKRTSERLKRLYGDFLDDEDFLLVSLTDKVIYDDDVPLPSISPYKIKAAPFSDQSSYYFPMLGMITLLLIAVTVALPRSEMHWQRKKKEVASCQLAEETERASATELKNPSKIENEESNSSGIPTDTKRSALIESKLDMSLSPPLPELVSEPTNIEGVRKSEVEHRTIVPSGSLIHKHREEMQPGIALEDTELIEKTDSNGNIPSTIVSSSTIFESKQCHMNLDQANETVRDAEIAAKTIMLAGIVFTQHGLDPRMAIDFALRRQQSIHANGMREVAEKRKSEIEVCEKREGEQRTERRHREKIAVMNFESNWREKLGQAHAQCVSAGSRGSIVSVALTLAFKLCRTNANLLGGSDSMLDLMTAMVCGCGTSATESTPGYSLTYAFSRVSSSTFFLNSCYLYCIVRCICVLCVSGFMHRLSTAFRLPTPVHHVINLGALLGICYPSWISELNNKLLTMDLLRLFLPHAVTFGVLVAALWIFHSLRRHSMEKLGLSIDRSCMAINLATYDSICLGCSLAPILIPFLYDRDARDFLLEQFR